MTIAEIKAHEEKISAQLHEAKALLEEVEAHARRKKAQAEIETITGLKTRKQEIEKKLQQLVKTGVEAKTAVQIKADIEAEVAKLKTSLGEMQTGSRARRARTRKDNDAELTGERGRKRTKACLQQASPLDQQPPADGSDPPLWN